MQTRRITRHADEVQERAHALAILNTNQAYGDAAAAIDGPEEEVEELRLRRCRITLAGLDRQYARAMAEEHGRYHEERFPEGDCPFCYDETRP